MIYTRGWSYMCENHCNRMMVKKDKDSLIHKFLPDNFNTSIWRELIILGALGVFAGERISSKADHEWLVEWCAFRAWKNLQCNNEPVNHMKVCNIRQMSLVDKSWNIKQQIVGFTCHCTYCDVALAYSRYCDVDDETIHCTELNLTHFCCDNTSG